MWDTDQGVNYCSSFTFSTKTCQRYNQTEEWTADPSDWLAQDRAYVELSCDTQLVALGTKWWCAVCFNVDQADSVT